VHALIVFAQVLVQVESAPDLVDAARLVPELQVDLRYATADNFLGEAIYKDLTRCFLHKDAAQMLYEAEAALRFDRPALRLRVYDCARPQFVQEAMWKLVAGTPKADYVADPKRRSIHNYGCAVDLTVADAKGRALDMGTEFDHFGLLARPDHEKRFLAAGKLTATQVANRQILRKAMRSAGWVSLPNEWWHYDCMKQKEARRRYRPIP
jgi:D-alanyl-D-alanine dipeptidase